MQEQEVCPHCAAGLKVVKTKRQWVHWTLSDGVVVCKRERLVAAFVADREPDGKALAF